MELTLAASPWFHLFASKCRTELCNKIAQLPIAHLVFHSALGALGFLGSTKVMSSFKEP